MPADPTIFDEPHHQALELLAIRALAGGDAETAFALADRRCRTTPAPTAHCFVLRAEASYRMGATAAAISDLDVALEISPADVAINRRMLAWSRGWRRRAAAAAILAGDRDIATLQSALTIIERDRQGGAPGGGERDGRPGWASIAVLDDAIRGWATWGAWNGNATIELSIADPAGSITIALKPDRNHPLGGRETHAVAIDVVRPRSRLSQTISSATRHHTFFSIRAPANDVPRNETSSNEASPPATSGPGDVGTTVIVPVYQDFAATKACLSSLFRAIGPGVHARVVIVDDASQDRRIRRYLARLGSMPSVEVLTNRQNMGFVGAVNRALGGVAAGDVVLLNADTIVPPGFLERLARAAHAAPDIGTVTPLSNNGDFMSFPTANTVNPLGSAKDIEAVDRIAAAVNRGRIIDVPNGIGFCLYVARRCLDRTGALSERFHRG
jgi:hypothetical protein